MSRFLFLYQGITQKQLYGWLASRKINWQAIWQKLCTLIGADFLHDGNLLLQLDDTSYGKSGKKIHDCETHFDHAAKRNASSWLWGYCRVVLSVQRKIHGRWVSMPVKQQKFLRKEKNTASKNQIAGQLIGQFLTLFVQPAKTYILCDSWFSNFTLWASLQKFSGVHLISRLRKNSVLHEKPKLSKGKRGRPRKFGDRLGSFAQIAKTRPVQQIKMAIYSKVRTVQYTEFTCISKSLKQEIKVVLIHLRNGTYLPLFSTDLDCNPERMISYYVGRWKIESGFKELKHELGALDNQARKESSVENHFELCCFAMTASWYYCHKQNKAPRRRYGNRESFSFSDLRDQIRQEYYRDNIWGFCSEKIKASKNKMFELVEALAA